MDYQQIRRSLKTGDAVFFRAHEGTPREMTERWIVKHSTASPYTHVGVIWVSDGGSSVWVMDITTKGCAPRLLSTCGDFDLAQAPKPLTPEALRYAQECFGVWEYSKWQAVLGELKRLTIGSDAKGQCAEYALSIWKKSGMAPTDKATPGACADGAMLVWGSPLISIKNPQEPT